MQSPQPKIKTQALFWLRLSSTLIDLAIIYCISILLQALIWKFTFVDLWNIFTAIFILYYFVAYLTLKGRTPAKILTGLKITANQSNNNPFKNIFLREIILKGISGILIPAFILKIIFPIWSPLFTILILAVILLLSLIFLVVLKNTWRELLSKIRTEKAIILQRSIKNYTFVSVTFLMATALIIIIYPFYSKKEQFATSFYPKYPITDETTKYAYFVKNNTENPVDYIFHLFNQYDIVVLSERYHPEYTQYEFISKLLNDKRFIKNVGNIFTETGSVSFQDTLNTYLHTSFKNEEELKKSTATLQRNSNGVWEL